MDPEVERRQVERIRALRAGRDAERCRAGLAAVSRAAADGSNLVVPIVEAVEAHATVGEVADAMQAVTENPKNMASMGFFRFCSHVGQHRISFTSHVPSGATALRTAAMASAGRVMSWRQSKVSTRS